MTRKLKYVRLPAFYYLTEGLTYDIGPCAEVLDAALVNLDATTKIPNEIVRWNRRGGLSSGRLNVKTEGRIAIEIEERLIAQCSTSPLEMTRTVKKLREAISLSPREISRYFRLNEYFVEASGRDPEFNAIVSQTKAWWQPAKSS